MIFEYLYRKLFERNFSLTFAEFAELWGARETMKVLKELDKRDNRKGWVSQLKQKEKENEV
jgi:hypothetical protein